MSDSSRTLKVAIPKGSLQQPTIELLAKAGYEIYVSARGLRPSSNDPELDLYLIRAQEIGRYLGQGFIDCGITGYDWAYENGVDLVDLGELPYSRATANPTRWVLVVPEDSPIRKPEDLEGKRIATEGVGITERYLKERGIKAEVEFSWGATEVKVPDLVDAIVDVTETGDSIDLTFEGTRERSTMICSSSPSPAPVRLSPVCLMLPSLLASWPKKIASSGCLASSKSTHEASRSIS